mgnify:CR=1 FL=1
MLKWSSLIVFLIMVGCSSSDSGESNEDTSDPTGSVPDNGGTNPTDSTLTFTIEENPDPSASGMAEFTKYVSVLGLSVYAEAGVEDAYVLHAAHVLAELLDNDEDGNIDDEVLITELRNRQALVPMFNREGSAAENDFFENYRGEGVSAVLYGTEIDPSQPGRFGADATIEEIMHTINHVGHREIYPDAFELEPDSSLLTAAMDVARGGQFVYHPGTYPDDAWYHYDDTTCDYRCMAIEYLYWAQVTNMGILNDPQTCQGIANEWEPCSPELLESMDTLVHALITDPQYKLPQLAPDGSYGPAANP